MHKLVLYVIVDRAAQLKPRDTKQWNDAKIDFRMALDNKNSSFLPRLPDLQGANYETSSKNQ
jgi:hypothetical protein